MAGLTAKQMQYEAQIMYEAIASADAPGYSDKQWSILLTQAQENVVMELLRVGADSDELRRRAISKLISEIDVSNEDIESDSIFGESAYRVPFPTGFLHILRDTANHSVKVKPVSHDFYHSNINNPFENPYEEEFWRLMDKEGVIIVTDGTELDNYWVMYVKKPLPIDTTVDFVDAQTPVYNCELDSSTHRQIVTEAAKLAHAYTSNQFGYQVQTLESNRARYGPQAQ